MRAIAYVRVSSEEQAATGLSLETQRATLAALAAARGDDLVETIEDAGKSAATLKRPGLQRALEQLRAGGADVLLCVKADRLTRAPADLETLLAKYFGDGAPYTLVLAAEPHDAKTPTGKLMLRLMAALGAFELDQVAARTRTVIEHKRATGRAIGGTPFGYDRAGDTLVPNDAEQLVLARAAALSGAGLGLRAIARQLGADGARTKHGSDWTATAVKRLLAHQLGK